MMATWQFDDTRLPMVEYAPGYAADRCCAKGRIRLRDAPSFTLTPAMSYQVGEGGALRRLHSVRGARLFIVA
jgi:hypothetical protein